MPIAGSSSRRWIPPAERTLDGIALSRYEDPGWGRMVADWKYGSRRFPSELIQAAARAVRASGFRPAWLTWVPSERRDALVAGFAARLTKALNVEARSCVFRVRRGPPQKSVESACAQFENVWGAFEARQVLEGPCLLVDDIVDSGWTLAAVGAALRRAGSGPVMPLALSSSTPRRRRR
jgi:ATP-dependent DNA helicase RecQ